MADARRVLGIDPGTRVTGYGVLGAGRRGVRYVASGCIRTGGGEMPQRLGELFDGVRVLIDTHRPTELAIETAFVSRNAGSALKLGQARGVVIAAAVAAGLPVAEYAPRRVKLAVVGTGRASKEQVQHMVARMLSLGSEPPSDAADALAIGICHVNTAPVAGRAL